MDDTDDIVTTPDDEDAVGLGIPSEDTLDELRDMPVGTNDPNIVGDAGAGDVPPGTDPKRAGEFPLEDAD